MKFMKGLISRLPTLISALLFAIAVWIFAVTQSDPTESRVYPQPIALDVIGIDQSLMIVNDINETISLTLRAPSSILNQLESERSLINATLDLSGLGAGVHTLTPQVDVSLSPSEVVRINPPSIFVKLEGVVTKTFPIEVKLFGNPAIGYETKEPILSAETAMVTGPESLVEAIDRIVAEVDIENVIENVQSLVTTKALDVDGNIIDTVSINPLNVQVQVPVNQRGGYGTVTVKPVTSGQIAPGYKQTSILVLPQSVTIFSSDPQLIEDMPGFVETTPINLNGANADLEIRVSLNLPEGISVVGSQNVTIRIGIDPIESSISFSDIPITLVGLGRGLKAELSPEFVDVLLSGPLDLLGDLDPASLTVIIDLTNRGPGTYQLVAEVVVENDNLNVDSILPNTIEVTITRQ